MGDLSRVISVALGYGARLHDWITDELESMKTLRVSLSACVSLLTQRDPNPSSPASAALGLAHAAPRDTLLTLSPIPDIPEANCEKSQWNCRGRKYPKPFCQRNLVRMTAQPFDDNEIHVEECLQWVEYEARLAVRSIARA